MASEAHLHAWEQRLRDWEAELEALTHMTDGLGEIQFRDHLLHLPVEKIQRLQPVLEGHARKKCFVALLISGAFLWPATPMTIGSKVHFT